jgi:hypothetical protein
MCKSAAGLRRSQGLNDHCETKGAAMFGLFTNSREKASRAAVEAIRPMIATLQHSIGLPAGFWIDPYAIGFVHFMIVWHAKLATHGKITGADLGFVLSDAFTALSNMNGVEIVRHSNTLENDPDFNRGADDAAAIAFYSVRNLKNEMQHDLVKRATAIADRETGSLSEQERRNRIMAMMYVFSFHSEIKKRFENL